MPVRELCAARVRDGSHVQKGQTSHVELSTTHTPGLFILPCDSRASLSREVLLSISPSYVPVMQHEPVSPSAGSRSQVLSRLLRLRSELQTVLSGQLKRNPLPPPAPGSWKASPCRLGAAAPGAIWTEDSQASNVCETTCHTKLFRTGSSITIITYI